MSKNVAFLLLAFITVLFCGFRFKKPTSTMQWQGIEKVSELYKAEEKPILVDLYTDWCHYCRVMDQTTYSNDSLTQYVAQHFYAAKLNAEYRKDLLWMGKNYKYVSKYNVHELAIMLTKGSLVYPSTIIVPPTGEPMVVGGGMPIYRIESILKYYGSDSYKTMSYDNFNLSFSSKW